MTIHSEHPFLGPESQREPSRRLRGRLGGVVTLWTAGDADAGRAGLTVSSLMVAGGEPGAVLALVDPDSDLLDVLESTGRAVVALLRWPHRDLAEIFAGTAPAPGGMFVQADFTPTEWGPLLSSATTWAGVRLVDTTEVGWSTLVTCAIEQVTIGDDPDPLVHRRGRYQRPPADPAAEKPAAEKPAAEKRD
ncbi:flavin reductase family protein [Nocardioides pacificus]